MIENIIKDMSQLELLQSISFRYFNAAGASFDTDIGEAHKPETHLIPNIIDSYLNKKSLKYLEIVLTLMMAMLFEIIFM